MDTLVFFLVALALGTANPIVPITIFGPSLDDRIKTAIDNNVQWLLSGIRNGTLEGPDLPRAVVALFLAEPGFFSPGHEIGQELRDKVRTTLTELIRQRPIQADDPWRFFQRTAPSFIPSEELALYVQALLVSCVDPFDFLGYDLTDGLYKSVVRYHCDRGNCNFPSPAMLALCNARATSRNEYRDFMHDAIRAYGGISSSMRLTDEEAFLTMTFGCLESSNYSYPSDIPWNIRLRHPLYSSGYRHYPSNLTVEDFQEMMRPDGDLLGNTTSVFAIAASMQNLMYNHRLRVSDLPWAVDFLLKSQDEDGSWGQSTLNSFFVLPVLSNRNFLDITSDHCPAVGGYGGETSENESLEDTKRMTLTILDPNSRWFFYLHPSATLYDALKERTDVNYRNGTDGKPYLHSFEDYENNPETGYFWFTYEQTKWPKESFTLLTRSHADLRFKPSSKYLMWYRKKSEVETQNDENEIEAGFQMES